MEHSENDAVRKLLSDNRFKVTGGMIKSIVLCERQAWFHQEDISIVRDHDYIQLGNLVEDSYYDEKEEQHIIDGMISPDNIEDGTIYETKKSSGALEASKAQLKYYIWYLNRTREDRFSGVLRIPDERKTIEIESVSDSYIIPKIEQLHEIFDGEIPEFEKVEWCANCAYKDICWTGQGGNYE